MPSLQNCLGVGAQGLEQNRLLLELGEDSGDILILQVPFEFDKEDVGPLFRAGWPGVYARQADAAAPERLQQVEEGPGPGLLRAATSREVLSRPLGGTSSRPMIRNRVVLSA